MEGTRRAHAPCSPFRCAGLCALSPPVREATAGPFELRLEVELHGSSAPRWAQRVKTSGNFTLRAALGESEPLRLVKADVSTSWGRSADDAPWQLWAALGRVHLAEVGRVVAALAAEGRGGRCGSGPLPTLGWPAGPVEAAWTRARAEVAHLAAPRRISLAPRSRLVLTCRSPGGRATGSSSSSTRTPRRATSASASHGRARQVRAR